ncbi:MAG TPA: hypothetical protein VMD77_12720 [Candidatus Baltobacteraceae bacterium]|nr:hypothetical protein [Candidatus Baltobacteraceae bacterium]
MSWQRGAALRRLRSAARFSRAARLAEDFAGCEAPDILAPRVAGVKRVGRVDLAMRVT